MTSTAIPPPPAENMTRRFSGKKLARLIEKRDERESWVAHGAKVTEMTVRNWLSGKKPGLDAYLDLVDFLKREGIDESEILNEIK